MAINVPIIPIPIGIKVLRPLLIASVTGFTVASETVNTGTADVLSITYTYLS